MDPQSTVARDELYHIQMDIKHVQAVQINHADRLLRLEKRQADDAALKSVWGVASPFPGVLSGTPQQGPVPNPSVDVFDDFDDEQQQNLLGSLQLETFEEPVRRGASRANSVRFDISALHGSSWTQGPRNSGDFGGVRPSSGLGSHPMTERSLSHKSDGRHSSAGHSVHSMPSGRTSSLGLDTNFIIGSQEEDSPLDTADPPPGLFILGPVPAIIRCWLTTDFSHKSLLYATVCTGSQRSTVDYSLVVDLNLSGQVQKDSVGRYNITLPVYLPEAVITQSSSSSRSNSPAPQLPALKARFKVVGVNKRTAPEFQGGMKVFLGSDTLRMHNADVLFSQNLMTLYGTDRNKLSVPFVRPEDENMFKNLCTTVMMSPEKRELLATAPNFTPAKTKQQADPEPQEKASDQRSDYAQSLPSQDPGSKRGSKRETDDASHPLVVVKAASSSKSRSASVIEEQQIADSVALEKSPDTTLPANLARRESGSGIWGPWRHGNTAADGTINGNDEARGRESSTSGYQPPTRGARGLKVLKQSKSSSSTGTGRSSSAARTGATYEPASSSASGDSRRKSQASGCENGAVRWESKRSTSDDHKKLESITNIPRSSNPVGGASAFAWMNANKQKAAAAGMD